MLKKILSWPWAQAALWLSGVFAMLMGASGSYGPNWGPIVVGAVFVAAAIALGFLRVQRQRLERRSVVAPIRQPATPTERKDETAPQMHQNDLRRDPRDEGIHTTPLQSNGSVQRKPWWHGLVTLLAIVAGAVGARTAINYFQSPEQQVARMSDREIVERLERDVIGENAAYSSTFVRMKRDFPTEYDQLTRRMTELVREGASEDRAFVVGRDFMASFFADNRPTMRSGSDSSLAAFLDSQTQLLVAVGAADADSCAAIIETGRFEPRAGMALLPTTSEVLNAANNAMFDAILTGRSEPVQRSPITDEEWIAVFDRAEALGADSAVLSSLGTTEFSGFAAAHRCAAVTTLYQAMNEGEQSLRARFAVELMGS